MPSPAENAATVREAFLYVAPVHASVVRDSEAALDALVAQAAAAPLYVMDTESYDRLQAAEAERDRMADALRRVQEQQSKTVDWLRANGIIVRGPLGTDPDNWEHVAFSIYSDLCQTEAIARAALDGTGQP